MLTVLPSSLVVPLPLRPCRASFPYSSQASSMIRVTNLFRPIQVLKSVKIFFLKAKRWASYSWQKRVNDREKIDQGHQRGFKYSRCSFEILFSFHSTRTQQFRNEWPKRRARGEQGYYSQTDWISHIIRELLLKKDDFSILMFFPYWISLIIRELLLKKGDFSILLFFP